MAANKKLVTALIITSYLLFFIAVLVLTLLALDVFTVPYLTPFAHFLKLVFSPFVVFIMPLYIGTAIKLYRHTPFPSRKMWLFQTCCFIIQQLGRVLNNLATLYDWSKLGNGSGFMGLGLQVEGLCGLGECKGSWVEAALIVNVILGEGFGWSWDGGYVQKWVDAVAEQSIKKEAEKKGNAEKELMEKGEVVGEKSKLADEKAPQA